MLGCLGMRSLLLTVKVLRPGTTRTGDGYAAGSLGNVTFFWRMGDEHGVASAPGCEKNRPGDEARHEGTSLLKIPNP